MDTNAKMNAKKNAKMTAKKNAKKNAKMTAKMAAKMNATMNICVKRYPVIGSHVLLLCCVGLLITGCGYTPMLKLDRVGTPLRISNIENQTAYRNLSASLAEVLRGQLRSSGVNIADRQTPSAAKMDIRIFSVSVSTTAIRVVKNSEQPVNRKWQLDALVTFESHTGERLFGPEVLSVSALAATPETVSGELSLSEHCRLQLLEELSERLTLLVGEHL